MSFIFRAVVAVFLSIGFCNGFASADDAELERAIHLLENEFSYEKCNEILKTQPSGHKVYKLCHAHNAIYEKGRASSKIQPYRRYPTVNPVLPGDEWKQYQLFLQSQSYSGIPAVTPGAEWDRYQEFLKYKSLMERSGTVSEQTKSLQKALELQKIKDLEAAVKAQE